MTSAGGLHRKTSEQPDDLTVVLARERFMVAWDRQGLQLRVAGWPAPIVMSAQEGRHLADLLAAAAELEEAA